MTLKLARTGTALLTAATIAVILAIPELLADSRPECEQADEWVRAHMRALPTGYAEFTAFPDTYRRRIFEVLTPEAKARLWGEHLDRALVQRQLTRTQRQIVVEARHWVSADRYRTRQKPPEGLVAGIKAEFSQQDQFAIFQSMGAESGRVSVTTWQILVKQWAARAAEVLAAPNCNCNLENGEICGTFVQPTRYCCCGTPGSQCNETSFGCGFLGCCSCYGFCMIVPDCT